MEHIRDLIYHRKIKDLCWRLRLCKCPLERDYILKGLEGLIPGINNVDLAGLIVGEFFPNLLHSMSLDSRLGQIEALDAGWNHPYVSNQFKVGIKVEFDGGVSISYALYDLLPSWTLKKTHYVAREYLTFHYKDSLYGLGGPFDLVREVGCGKAWDINLPSVNPNHIRSVFSTLKGSIPGFEKWWPNCCQRIVGHN